MLRELKGNPNTSDLLQVTKFPFLKKLASAFDRVKWHKCRLIYRPCCSSTTNGNIMVGIDWDAQNEAAVSAAMVGALTPVMDVPVWQSASITLPSSRLQSRKEYIVEAATATQEFDLAPGYVVYWGTADADKIIGHLWVDYDVTLFGTHA